MKAFNLFLALLAISCLSTGCEQKPTERELLFDEVMDIHDECMPEVVTLNQIKRSLRKSKEGMQDSIMIKKVNVTISNIENANEGMMVWMRKLEIPKEVDPDEEVVSYLKDQKVKIQKVSDEMFAALKEGNDLLKTLKVEK